jgi:MoaA/NifB/PqqE/SkfB family radical SAM enzyme
LPVDGLPTPKANGFAKEDGSVLLVAAKRRVMGIGRRFREARMFAQAMRSPRHPIQAQIVPMRRCNLSCTYCNEFDDHSAPVPTPEILNRIDHLARLGTTIITISGGEPLLHPELDEIIRAIRAKGVIATLITNGYLLTADRIQRLNRAGLDHVELSIDNVLPDEVSKKSLKVLDQKLVLLKNYAEFDVNINTVLGTGVRNSADALTIGRRARQLGFSSTVGLVHDHNGQLLPLDSAQQLIYAELTGMEKRLYSRYNQFQQNLVRGLPNHWHCHAGSRYLYICEDGLVHYCSQQRGRPGVPLSDYTSEHLAREYHTVKPCAPFCTVSCVHQTAMADYVREKPLEALPHFLPATHGINKALAWLFLNRATRWLFSKAALWILKVE